MSYENANSGTSYKLAPVGVIGVVYAPQLIIDGGVAIPLVRAAMNY